MRVALLRPSFGCGGAERFVADAAHELLERGHEVTLHAPGPVNPTLLEGLSGRLTVDSRGAFLPDAGLGRGRALKSMLRIAWAASEILRSGSAEVVLSDLLPSSLPRLRRRTRAALVFYGHYPDLLLTPARGALYQWYRRPLDLWEERGLRAAHRIAVNSRFTSEAFRRVFPGLTLPLEVLSPGVEVPADEGVEWSAPEPESLEGGRPFTLLSLNRFSPVKNLDLALDALRELKRALPVELFQRVRLVLAGHDPAEAPEVAVWLERRIERDGLSQSVRLVRSPSEPERRQLFAQADAFVYTPIAEHFGYGPLEAMAFRLPVVAVDSGGPRETVLHEVTGLLVPPQPEAFARAITTLLRHPQRAREMGEAGRRHVAARFSRRLFGTRLEQLLLDAIAARGTR